MLKDLGIRFKIQSPATEEKRLRGEPVRAFVQRLAREKAHDVAQTLGFIDGRRALKKDWFVLAADTIVFHTGTVFGKPTNQEEAFRILSRLSGKTHDVITSYHWMGLGPRSDSNARNPEDLGLYRELSNTVVTKVTFAERPKEFWRWYISTGEPMDKAGAYGAQGIGMTFIDRINGSYSNVIGLPLPQVLHSFEKLFGLDLHESFGKHSND